MSKTSWWREARADRAKNPKTKQKCNCKPYDWNGLHSTKCFKWRAGTPTSTAGDNGWEKEFDKFTLQQYGDGWNVVDSQRIKPSQVKQFITDLLAQEREKTLAEVREVRQHSFECGWNYGKNKWICNEDCYTQGLERYLKKNGFGIRSLISKLTKDK